MIKCRDRFEEEVEERWNDKWRSLLGIFTADLKECIPEVDFYFIKRADFYDIVKTFNGQRGGIEINKLRDFIQNRLIKFRHNKYINVVGQGSIDTVNYYIGDKNFYNSMKDRDTFHYYKILCTSKHLSNCCSNFICEYDRFGNDRKYLIDEELGALCIAKTDTLELKIGQFERIEPELLKTIKDTEQKFKDYISKDRRGLIFVGTRTGKVDSLLSLSFPVIERYYVEKGHKFRTNYFGIMNGTDYKPIVNADYNIYTRKNNTYISYFPHYTMNIVPLGGTFVPYLNFNGQIVLFNPTPFGYIIWDREVKRSTLERVYWEYSEKPYY